MHLDSESIDGCFEAIEAAITRDKKLAKGLRESRAEFFPEGKERGESATETGLAARRHLEWFLLERTPAGEEGGKIAALIRRCARECGVDAEPIAQSLENSHASVFEVLEVDPGRGMLLWDIAGLFECAAVEVEGSRILKKGDVVAGRIFPIGDSLYRVSRAAASWRNPKLLSALRADLARALSSRPATEHGGVRMRQAEIEAMFHSGTDWDVESSSTPAAPRARRSEAKSLVGADALPVPRAVDRARTLLLASGVGQDGVDTILGRLSREAPDSRSVLPGAADTVGTILETLAFETSIDLELARRTLLEAWEELHGADGRAAPLPERAEPRDVAAAVAEFDRKRQEGAPLEQVFRELERDLDIDIEDSGEELEEADTPVPDFPGVVGAMVEEFLWDEERTHGRDEAQPFGSLRSLGRFAAGVGVFENLGPRDLSVYACRWLVDSGGLTDPRAASDLLDGLSRFCLWADENHDLALSEPMAPVIASLRVSLPRIVEANRGRAPGSPSDGEDWFEFVGRGPGDACEVLNLAGKPRVLSIDPRITSHLRRGDLVRGRLSPGGGFELAACYPAELRRDATI